MDLHQWMSAMLRRRKMEIGIGGRILKQRHHGAKRDHGKNKKAQTSMAFKMQFAMVVAERAIYPRIAPARVKAKAKVAKVARVSMGPREMEKDGQRREDGQ